MSKIKQEYPVWRYRPSRITELVMREGGVISTVLFSRPMPCGLVLVHSYLQNGSSMVEAVVDGEHWIIWYNHAPFSIRQAALLVNRFLRDVAAEKGA